MPQPNRARYHTACLLWAVTATLLVVVWQWATIQYNRDGNWTALYCTGTIFEVPPSLQGEDVYLFLGAGYDGQYYHYIAHDPLFREGLSAHVDDPRLRYRRVLLPGLASLLSAGRSAWVDTAYLVLVWLSVFLGVYWLARLAVERGGHPAWGLGFLLLPAVIASVDRLTVDVALLALCAGLALYTSSSTPGWTVALMLAAAGLVRETGLVLILAAVVFCLLEGTMRRAVALSLSAMPALLWFAFVHQNTKGEPYPASFVPFSGIARALLDPMPYADKASVIRLLDQIGDALALAGIVLALGLALRLLARRPLSFTEIACLCFALMGIFLQRADHWRHVFDFGRVYSPLLLFLGLDALTSRRFLVLLPVVLMLPRVALQVGSQIVGVILGPLS